MRPKRAMVAMLKLSHAPAHWRRETPAFRSSFKPGHTTSMLKKILIAIDGSDGGVRATSIACEIASKVGASVVLLHVQTAADTEALLKLRASLTQAFDIASQDEQQELLEARRYIDGLDGDDLSESELARLVGAGVLRRAKAMAHALGVHDVSAVLDEGNPAEVIIEYATASSIDLIALGRRGLGPVRELLWGSVSQRVARLAPCACLTVA
jgi:nucleotide-binding universal stress UspA family protein